MAIRGGAKGTTPEADVTSSSIDSDHQALDVVAHLLGADGKPAGSTNPLLVGGDGLELLHSINDRLGALIILLTQAHSLRDEPTSLIAAAQQLRTS